MDDPETRDREPDGTEGPETGATMMRAGPEGSPEAVGTSLAGAAGPVRATLDGVRGAEAPTTAIDTEDATLAPRVGADPAPQPVPVIPGYRVEGELGRGGMGVVYRARQVRLNRDVAVKMILAGRHAGAEAAARFLAEAMAVAKLQHPNIVQIFHIDEHAGFPYFEMEYVGGGAWPPGSTAPRGRRARRRGWSRPWPGPWPRRTGGGSSTATSSRPTSC